MEIKRLLKGKIVGFIVIVASIIVIGILHGPSLSPIPTITLTPTPITTNPDQTQPQNAEPTSTTTVAAPTSTTKVTPITPPPSPEEKPALLNELLVHFIDVGQGDSILIDLGSDEVLIDGGEKSSGVTDYIKKYIDGPLEVMIATHPHADHIGGLIKVLEDFQVEEIWLNGDTATSKTYQDFMVAVNSEGAGVHQAKMGDTISLDNLNFSILNPPDTLFNDTNNNSIVLRMKYGNIVFLFAGDAEQKAEASMLVNKVELGAQILKAGHHCSKTSSSKAFLEKVSPEKAICMVGAGNSYGHPHQETLTALKDVGAETYRTDINGTIVVPTDGVDYKIETSK